MNVLIQYYGKVFMKTRDIITNLVRLFLYEMRLYLTLFCLVF